VIGNLTKPITNDHGDLLPEIASLLGFEEEKIITPEELPPDLYNPDGSINTIYLNPNGSINIEELRRNLVQTSE